MTDEELKQFEQSYGGGDGASQAGGVSVVPISSTSTSNQSGSSRTTSKTESSSEQTRGASTNTTTSNQSTSVGELPEELKQQKEQDIQRSWEARGFHWNPETKRWEDANPTIGDVVKIRESNAPVERLNRLKGKEQALKNALGILADIGIGAAGGNVYKREKDTVGKEAADDNERMRQQELKAEQEAKEKDRQRMKDAADAAARLGQYYDNLRGKVTSGNTTQNIGEQKITGKNESETTQKTNTSSRQSGTQDGTQAVRGASSYGRGGHISVGGEKVPDVVTASVRRSAGDGNISGYKNFTLTTDKARAAAVQYARKVTEVLPAYYLQNKDTEVGKRIKQYFADCGIKDIDKLAKDPSKHKYTMEDYKRLLDSGIVMNINGLAEELNKVYMMSDEYQAAAQALVSSAEYKAMSPEDKKKAINSLSINFIPLNKQAAPHPYDPTEQAAGGGNGNGEPAGGA